MRVLITADTVGGVWTYTRELVTALVRRGVTVTLVSFGGMPSTAQTRWMKQLPRLTYLPTAYKLEWMQDSVGDMQASSAYLRAIVRQTRPDLLHFSQFYYASLDWDAPSIVIAHSDVVSWWVSVHGREPPETSWMKMNWYRETVTRGLAGATSVIAPSQWMLDQVARYYLRPIRAKVVHNGRTPALFRPDVPKELKIITAGRLWDQGKNAGLLLEVVMPAPVQVVGASHAPRVHGAGFAAAAAGAKIDLQGWKDEDELAGILARAAIYAAPARYEPFGLAPVEAALSGCALVLSDIGSFRELWDGAAIFFRNNDVYDLKRVLELLVREPRLREEFGGRARDHALRRFNAERMADDYLEIYRSLTPAAAAVA